MKSTNRIELELEKKIIEIFWHMFNCEILNLNSYFAVGYRQQLQYAPHTAQHAVSGGYGGLTQGGCRNYCQQQQQHDQTNTKEEETQGCRWGGQEVWGYVS